MRTIAIAVAVALAACSPAAAPADAPAGQPQTGLSQVPLTIASASGVHNFTVDVASTPGEQERGLMFVRSLGPDRGMLFPFDPPQHVSFWMHDTLIPLDLLYIRADGTIAQIINAKAMDDTSLPSSEPIANVLEIAGGRAAELGIAEGDKVTWGK